MNYPTIDTPKGRETLFNNKDFVDIVREFVSDSAAEYLEEILNENEYLSKFYERWSDEVEED